MPRGQVITVTDIEIAKVGAYNLPSGVITDGKSVIGKYAATDLYAGDYLFPEKLSDDNKSANDVLPVKKSRFPYLSAALRRDYRESSKTEILSRLSSTTRTDILLMSLLN